MNRYSLSGKAAVVTGAAGLLGREHALALLESGCSTVILTDVQVQTERAENLLRDLIQLYPEHELHLLPMDVTDEAAIQQVCSKFGGKIDILINNAAVNPQVDSVASGKALTRFEKFSLESWNQQIEVGLTGAFLCSRIFGSEMARSKGGAIVNIASDLSVIAPDPRIYAKPDTPAECQPVKPVTYSVVKTGLIGLTRYLAVYWAKQGVRVNALSPGGVFVDQPQQFVDNLTELIPLGRMAVKDEYRAAIQFLCSNASTYMTGHNLVMDGGRSCW